MLRSAPFLLLFAFASFGCSSDEPSGLAGMYRTTSHVESRGGCSDRNPIGPDPAYFLVEDEALANGLVVHAWPCASPDAGSCNRNGPSLAFLAHRAGRDFLAEQLQTNEEPTGCWVQWTGTWIVGNSQGVELRLEHRSDDIMTSNKCASWRGEDAIPKGRTLPCRALEVRAGTRL